MIHFTFLGANGSCQSPDSGNTSLLIRGTRGCVCVDTSVNIASVVDADVDAVVLTHEHIDHVYALPSLLHQLWLTGRTRELKVYTPEGLEPLINGLIDLFGIRSKKNIFPITVAAEAAFSVGSLHCRLFRTDHTETSAGLIVEEEGKRLVYTCDTRPVRGENIPDEFRGTDVLIHETSGTAEQEETLIRKGHSSGADAGRLAKEAIAGKLFLCHLPADEESRRRILREASGVFPDTRIPEILKEYSVQRAARSREI